MTKEIEFMLLAEVRQFYTVRSVPAKVRLDLDSGSLSVVSMENVEAPTFWFTGIDPEE